MRIVTEDIAHTLGIVEVVMDKLYRKGIARQYAENEAHRGEPMLCEYKQGKARRYLPLVQIRKPTQGTETE